MQNHNTILPNAIQGTMIEETASQWSIRKGWSFFLGGGEASIDDGVVLVTPARLVFLEVMY